MSVTKIGPNVWRIKVSVRVPGADNPVKKRELFNGTKTEAECREADIIVQLKSGGSLAYTKNIRTFGEAVDLYVVKLQAQDRLSKGHKYKVDLIRRELGHLPLDAVPGYFEAWLKNLARTPAPGGKMRSPAALNRPVEIVRAVFNHLVALDEIPKNPITQIRFPKYKEKARDRYLATEERMRLLQAIRQRRPEMLPLIQYMLLVPCRVSELTSARREQYNSFTNTIYIPDSKADIPINKPVPEEMTEYFKNIPADCPWLFYWKDACGKYRPFVSIRRAWLDALKLAGLSNLRIHDLRHVSSTDLYNVGNPERQIMDIAGWKTPMLSNYRHKDSLRSAQGIVFMPPAGAVLSAPAFGRQAEAQG
jgi:integrase